MNSQTATNVQDGASISQVVPTSVLKKVLKFGIGVGLLYGAGVYFLEPRLLYFRRRYKYI